MERRYGGYGAVEAAKLEPSSNRRKRWTGVAVGTACVLGAVAVLSQPQEEFTSLTIQQDQLDDNMLVNCVSKSEVVEFMELIGTKLASMPRLDTLAWLCVSRYRSTCVCQSTD